jgi:small subunit ribosomal protein S6
MRIYETIFIIRPEAQEEEIETAVTQITTTITDGQGKVDKIERWGKRKLAYRVKGHREGHYILVQYSVESEVGLSKEIERRLKVADSVIKYLTVRIDESLKRLEKLRAAREKRAARKSTGDMRPREVSGAVRTKTPAKPTSDLT